MRRLFVALIVFASILAIGSIVPWQASAQSTEDPWAKPQNLSLSGSATNPTLFIDSRARVHVIWQDDFANLVYSRLNGDNWTTPLATGLHVLLGLPSMAEAGQSNTSIYSGQNPVFIAGPGTDVFAFWINQQSALYVTRVSWNDFTNVEGWGDVHLISSSAASFSVDVDARGEFHLAILRTFDDSVNPAGVYYTSSKSDGEDWGEPELLYESNYLRGQVGAEANLRLSVGGSAAEPDVYIAWDNRPRKQVLVMESMNGGETWNPPVLVAGPSPDSGSVIPFDIRVEAKKESALLIWQSGQPGSACELYYKFSKDRGINWSEALPLMDHMAGCTQANEFVADYSDDPQENFYLLTDIQNQLFLSAWNGTQWSEPQAQQPLSGFEDAETFNQVIYGCHKAAILNERLYIVGCDQTSGGDIWFTSRNLPSDSFWFSPPVWSQPAPVSEDNFDSTAVELVSTEDSSIHACLSHYQDSAVYCTYWNGTSWSHLTPVVQLPEGETSQLSLTAGPENELFLITGNSLGSLYFNQGLSSESMAASNWSTPTRLPIVHDGLVSSADVAWDAAGTIYVAYSVPVNEARGIYLVQSKDRGKSWSLPLQVSNSAKADIDFIGSPSLLALVDGSVHIIWKNQSIQVDGELQTRSLDYAHSEDGGLTFTEAEHVVEGPVTWREITVDSEGNLHRLWQQQDIMNTLLDQVSTDGGRSWQVAEQLSTGDGAPAVAVDATGRLHLLSGGTRSLLHWYWDRGRWRAETPFRWALDMQEESPAGLIAATVNSNGQMVLVRSAITGEAGEQQLLYTTRNLDLSSNQSNEQSKVRKSPANLSSPTEQPVESTAEPPLNPDASISSNSASISVPAAQSRNNDPVTLLAGALLPVALLLLCVLGIMVLKGARLKVR